MNPERIWFISDTHFCHTNMIEMAERPYNSTEDMDESLIRNWNNVVGKKDTVFHLGDFCMGTTSRAVDIFNQLSGNIHLIRGNHDSNAICNQLNWASVHDYFKLKTGQETIILCHYAIRSWDRIKYGTLHLYGHSHGNLPAIGKSMDVGVDATKLYRPLHISEVRTYMESRPLVVGEDHHK